MSGFIKGNPMNNFVTITNLYPRPDQPSRGLYNYRLFKNMWAVLGGKDSSISFHNVCLVPEWRPWRWAVVRQWKAPVKEGADFTHYVPVFYLPLLGRSINDLFYAWALKGVTKGIGRGDLVYVPWLYPDGVAAARVLHDRGARVWLMALGSDTLHLRSWWRRQKIRTACDLVEGIVCVANALSERLSRDGVAGEKLKVVPNGVEKELFVSQGRQEAWRRLEAIQSLDSRLKAAHQRVLFVGNLVPVKGVDLLMRAFAELSNKPHLMIIGVGPMRRALARLSNELGISERVTFLGRRPPSEVALWMNVADCLCLTSHSEGMPNVILEARAAGLPVVTTPAGACREVLSEHEHFMVVDTCSANDVAAGLRVMLSRDLSVRPTDPAIKSWREMAERVVDLMGIDSGVERNASMS
jgi:glycosyltransferase involved in cell wall biosynthesis